MQVEKGQTPLETVYPAFALVGSRVKELKRITYDESAKQAIEWAKDLANLLDELRDNWEKLHSSQNELPIEKSLDPKATASVRRRIITLFIIASRTFSTENSPDYYWPVTWEDREEDTQKVAEILGFWIENEEPVTATKAQDDLRRLIEAWYQADRQHMAWETSNEFFKPHRVTPELSFAKACKERFGSDWGKRARGRL